jgi:1-acyl-sn-glycerol-3-phosphate acyltransferase
MKTARVIVFVPLFVLFEFFAINFWPVTWLRWEIATPDTCCLTRAQILGETAIPALFVLLTHGPVLVALNELVRVAVLFAHDPKAAWQRYISETN